MGVGASKKGGAGAGIVFEGGVDAARVLGTDNDNLLATTARRFSKKGHTRSMLPRLWAKWRFECPRLPRKRSRCSASTSRPEAR